ncbi:UDP-glycosyltransferase 83A1-like isoform X1 [Coffea arabica]|uniref:UDP-glycosyltransferase 83A1-like isoform X1 n=1 Tax=Coffea arabica TaxID=13443 RepID=A0ABM4WA00_COFAR|nr:UDP-glycosyltransferase 83A1-like [Coffea arabica]
MGSPHVLAVPYPAQGHVLPLMELALCLVKHGIKVTFVYTEFDHKRVIESLSGEENVPDMMHLVSIPDGLESWEDRNDAAKSMKAIFRVIPVKLEALIEKINQSESDKVTCIIVDEFLGLALEVAKKMGVRAVSFSPAAAALYALKLNIPKLIDDGIIDSSGTIMKKQMVQLSPATLAMDSEHFAWASVGDATTRGIVFDAMAINNRTFKLADRIIGNSSNELEASVFTSFPEMLPIGPLLASNRLGKSVGSYWSEDSDCLAWLDKQPVQSVIYVAFGSLTVFDHTQFQELALGLELTNMPFLWVVRRNLTAETDSAYPKGFRDRIQGRGRLASWAPQQQVLSHPSVACFLSHCGWNSTMEGISNGVPFVCWPCFGDQFANRSYICDIWKVGLGLEKDENGIIAQGELKNKIEPLVTVKGYRERALDLKAKVMNSLKEDGCSGKNFNNLVRWIKDD